MGLDFKCIIFLSCIASLSKVWDNDKERHAGLFLGALIDVGVLPVIAALPK